MENTTKKVIAGVVAAGALAAGALVSDGKQASAIITSEIRETGMRNGHSADFGNLNQYLTDLESITGIKYTVKIVRSISRVEADSEQASIEPMEAKFVISFNGKKGYIYVGSDLAARLPAEFVTEIQTQYLDSRMSTQDWYNAIQETADRIYEKYEGQI